MGDTAKGQPDGLATLDSSGDVPAGQIPSLVALDAETVLKSLFDAYTVLAADTDNTPVALVIGASTVLGRKASGGIVALTGAELGAIISGIPAASVTGTAAVLGANTFTGKQTTPAATTGHASLNIPEGTAPTSPADGDVWTDGAHKMYIRLNGVTKEIAFV